MAVTQAGRMCQLLSVSHAAALSHLISTHVNGFKWTQRTKQDPFADGFVSWTGSPRGQASVRDDARGGVQRKQPWAWVDPSKVLPLCSCNCMEMMHQLGCPSVSNGGGHRHPQRAFQPTSAPSCEPLFSPLAVSQTKSPPALAVALQWKAWREAGCSQTSTCSQQECSVAVQLQLIAGVL